MSKKQPAPSGLVRARVLVSCAYGEPNDVVEVPQEVADASGELDADADAVKYADSLGKHK